MASELEQKQFRAYMGNKAEKERRAAMETVAEAGGLKRGITALEPELENYLAQLSPDSYYRLHKQASGKSPKQQREFLAALQYGDNEFQGAVQDYMPEGADPVDPLRYRTHYHPDAESGWNILGMFYPPNTPSGRYSKWPLDYGRDAFFLDEPDTVNTYGTPSANLAIQAHEYRHRQNLEGLPNKYRQNLEGSPNREYREGYKILNTAQDVMGAKTEKDLRIGLGAMAAVLNEVRGRSRVTGHPYVSEEDKDRAWEIAYRVRDKDTPIDELVKDAKFLLNHYFTKTMFNKSRAEAEEAEDAPLEDRMSPDRFREGRFYKQHVKEPSWLDRLKKVMRDS